MAERAKSADKLYSIGGPEGYFISREAAAALISGGDGDAALTYIYMLGCGGNLRIEQAAEEMKLPAGRIALAAERLVSLGLISAGEEPYVSKAPAERQPAPAPAPAEPQEIPAVSRYTAEEIARMVDGDPKLRQLAAEAEKKFARVLASSEYARLIGLYTEVGLSAETILLIINHCLDVNSKRGKRTTMRDVEKLGYSWSRLGIFDVTAAEEQIRRENRRDELTEQVRRALGLTDHPLSPTEGKYIHSWLEMGYSADALAEAYDRTVVNTGKLSWKYMDSIIRSWNEKGLVTLKDINASDGRERPKTERRDRKTEELGDVEWMRRFVSGEEKGSEC